MAFLRPVKRKSRVAGATTRRLFRANVRSKFATRVDFSSSSPGKRGDFPHRALGKIPRCSDQNAKYHSPSARSLFLFLFWKVVFADCADFAATTFQFTGKSCRQFLMRSARDLLAELDKYNSGILRSLFG